MLAQFKQDGNSGFSVRLGQMIQFKNLPKSCARHEVRVRNMEENTQIVEKQSNGLGTAGFVLALLSLIFCWVPFLNVILCLLGFIFSLIGVCKKNVKKGLAITGLILSIIAAIAIVILTVVLGYALLEML